MLIILGSFLLGLKLKCKSNCKLCKCCKCELELEKKENDDGSIIREIKIIKKTKSII